MIRIKFECTQKKGEGFVDQRILLTRVVEEPESLGKFYLPLYHEALPIVITNPILADEFKIGTKYVCNIYADRGAK